MNWAINDSALKSGVYYHERTDTIALVSDDNWFVVGSKDYPLYGWIKIGKF